MQTNKFDFLALFFGAIFGTLWIYIGEALGDTYSMNIVWFVVPELIIALITLLYYYTSKEEKSKKVKRVNIFFISSSAIILIFAYSFWVLFYGYIFLEQIF